MMLSDDQLCELLRRWHENNEYRPHDLVMDMIRHDARKRGVHPQWIQFWTEDCRQPCWWDNLVFVLLMEHIPAIYMKSK